MPAYTNEERLQMLLIYNECQQNARAAQRLYIERYPGERQPSYRTINRIAARFRDNGNINVKKSTGRPLVATDDTNETNILAFVNAHPESGTKRISAECGVSKSSVLRVLTKHHFHPYHISQHQGLLEHDGPSRVDYCNWLLIAIDDDPRFLTNVLWSDECTFHRNGVTNPHNTHHWAQSNPHLLRMVAHQATFKVNVWCGMLNDCIVGPYFLEGNLTGEAYVNFLSQTLAQYLDNLPLATLRRLWYQHDGAPPHTWFGTRNWLDITFPNRWIGRGGPVTWPARSPDLNPLDFFLWGSIQEVVYATEPLSQADLRNRIREACAAIQPDVLVNVQGQTVKRLQACVLTEGKHFEHFLEG